jgi:hypothetical protein
MVLCEGCCPMGVEVSVSEVRVLASGNVRPEVPCFCELCNQMIAEAPRVLLRSAVRGAFLLEGGAWRRLFLDRLAAMSRQPEMWASSRNEFVSIIMTWLEVMTYVGELSSLPLPDQFYEHRRGRVMGFNDGLDEAWVRRTVERVRAMFPVDGTTNQ